MWPFFLNARDMARVLTIGRVVLLKIGICIRRVTVPSSKIQHCVLIYRVQEMVHIHLSTALKVSEGVEHVCQLRHRKLSWLIVAAVNAPATPQCKSLNSVDVNITVNGC